MSLKEKIHEKLVSNTETILEANLDRAQTLFRIHKDGTIDVAENYRNAEDGASILIHVIGQRYAYEGGLQKSDSLQTDILIKKTNSSRRTFFRRLQELQKRQLLEKCEHGNYKLVVENLPKALDLIEELTKDDIKRNRKTAS
jgi:hypothetical protein